MLSRVAENLYWMGRYLERTDHLARYINVEYFSTLDSPHPQLHKIALLSIIDMCGLSLNDNQNLNEEEILVTAALDDNNPVSIVSALYRGRENARSVRDSISSELWEAINNFYHFVASYPTDVYKTKGLFDFTTNVTQHCSNVRGRILHTLLHDMAWKFINLGLLVERASQVVRIVISKLNDIDEINKLKLGATMHAQHWSNLLDCVEANDMCRKYYTKAPEKYNTIEFLLVNPSFPRSVISSLNQLIDYLKSIEYNSKTYKNSIIFKVGKLVAPFQFLEVEDIEERLPDFLQDVLSSIYKISDLITEEYFS